MVSRRQERAARPGNLCYGREAFRRSAHRRRTRADEERRQNEAGPSGRGRGAEERGAAHGKDRRSGQRPAQRVLTGALLCSFCERPDRERDLRRLERDAAGVRQGRPTYFARPGRAFARSSTPRGPDRRASARRARGSPVQRRGRGRASHPSPPDPPTPRRPAAIFSAATRCRASSGSCARWSRRTTSARPQDQRVHCCLPDADLSARSLGRGTVVGIRSGLHGAAREGQETRVAVASTPLRLMLLGLSALTALFVLVALGDRPLRATRSRRALAGRTSRVLFPVVALARRVRDRRRDPEQLRPLHRAGTLTGVLEHRDHPRSCARVPQATRRHELYVYAPRSRRDDHPGVPADAWLRGPTGTSLALDCVTRGEGVFVLMVPVTLGLGLINVNAVIDTFSPRAIDANSLRRRSKRRFSSTCSQGMFSVAIARCCFRRSRARGARRPGRVPPHGEQRPAADRVPAHSGAVVAPCWRADRAILYQRGKFLPHQTTVVAACSPPSVPGSSQRGDAELNARSSVSVERIPTAIALGNIFLNALLDLGFYRVGTWGIASRPRSVTSAARCLLVLFRGGSGRTTAGDRHDRR